MAKETVAPADVNASLETLSNTSLSWLADAPLFIDGDQIERFYDAVVRPEGKSGTTTLTFTKERAKEIGVKIGAEIEATPGMLTGLLSSIFSLKAKACVEGSGKAADSTAESSSIELHPIRTPQRQLVHLTAHYLANLPHRIFFAGEHEWRDKDVVARIPRALAFLDLPGKDEANVNKDPTTKLVPMAAEFEDGSVILLFETLTKKSGERPPHFPDEPRTDESEADLIKRRQDYWKFFDDNFSSMQCIREIEQAGTKHGRIRWIDFRLPLANDGKKTLHLHCCPAEEFDTGVFAYNFVRRGYYNGLRLVGTVRSGPSLNVLAIFEK